MDIRELIKSRQEQATVKVPVDVPDLDEVRVRRMKTKELIALGKLDGEEAGLALVAQSIVDESGAAVFADSAAVGELDWELANALINAANQVNGLGKAVQDAAKN